MYTVAGVDPGVNDSGLVVLCLEPGINRLEVWARAVPGYTDGQGRKQVDVGRIASELDDLEDTFGLAVDQVFVEKYRTRSNLKYDDRLVTAVQLLRNEIKDCVAISNSGMTKVITDDTLKLLELWKFQVRTHHNDTRAAARLALLGVAKDEVTNRYLYELIQSVRAGRGSIIHY